MNTNPSHDHPWAERALAALEEAKADPTTERISRIFEGLLVLFGNGFSLPLVTYAAGLIRCGNDRVVMNAIVSEPLRAWAHEFASNIRNYTDPTWASFQPTVLQVLGEVP